jgi:hypothetical protein
MLFKYFLGIAPEALVIDLSSLTNEVPQSFVFDM